MSYSITTIDSITFTESHARHMAAKVSADLKRMQRFYNYPSDADIASYETELIALMKAGYLGVATYGFKRNDAWIVPTLRYAAQDLQGASANDDDPGRVTAGADTSGAYFHAYMTYSSAWDKLTAAQQAAFKATLPFQRSGAPQPSVNGYFSDDKTYSAGGRALSRAVVRSY